MAFPSYTYAFTNGSTADASQVIQNFTDILNGVSDTTKDISVSALTVGGTATLNGNVTLGNNSSKTITFTGSMASTLNIGTTNTYDIGSATLGLRACYIAGTSTFTTAIKSAATTSWTFNLPVTAGTNLFALLTDGSGNTSWGRASTSPVNVVAKTTTYTATTSDDVITCSGSAFTVTLYAASGNSGRRLMIRKTDASLTNIITIAANGAELIDGTNTTTLNTLYETIEIVCDGTGWQILTRTYSTVSTAYTPALTSAGGGSITLNATSKQDPTGYWRRIGNYMRIYFTFKNGSGGAATGTAGVLRVSIPAITLDTTNFTSTTGIGYGQSSSLMTNIGGGGFVFTSAFLTGVSDQYLTFAKALTGSSLALADMQASCNLTGSVDIPISGWN